MILPKGRRQGRPFRHEAAEVRVGLFFPGLDKYLFLA